MRRGEINRDEAEMLDSLEGTLKEYNEGRGVNFVLVNMKNLDEVQSGEDELTKVEVIGNMPPDIVRHTLTKVLASLIVNEIHDDHVCDDCKDTAH